MTLPATSSCAHGQAVMPCACDADEPPQPRSEATAVPISVYSSWVGMPLTGVELVLGVARMDRDLGAQAALALADALGDVGCERLGLEGLADHDVFDRLVHDLLEARHVNARLLRVEVDVALERRRGRAARRRWPRSAGSSRRR